MIKAAFLVARRSPSPERPRPAFDVPEQPGTRYAVVTDKETTATAVAAQRPAAGAQPGIGRRLSRHHARSAVRATCSAPGSTSSARARTRRSSGPPPTARCSRRRGRGTRRSLQALVSNDGVARGLDALVTELQRVARFGFTATELARAKQAMMAGYERVVTESPDRESASRADEYTRNFLQDEALPTIWQELAFHRRFVPGDHAGRDQRARRATGSPTQNRLVVVVGAGSGRRRRCPIEAQLAAVVKAASAKRLEAYVDAAAGQTLMDAPPARGTIVKTTDASGGRHHRVDAVERRHRRAQADDAEGGSDPVPRRRRRAARRSRATPISFRRASPTTSFRRAASARFSAVDARQDPRRQGGRRHAVHRRDRAGHGRRQHAAGSRDDVPAAVPAVHAAARRSDRVRRDGVAGARRCSRTRWRARTSCSTRRSTPRSAGNSPRRQPETPATVDQWNLAKSLAFYKARFADASNFTFVFVGSFTPEAIKPLVETYLASLPATHAHETWRDLGITPPTGVVEKTIEKGIAPKSQVAIVFSGPFEYDDAHRLALRTMTLLLQSRLFDTIRQELGGTYSITADAGHREVSAAANTACGSTGRAIRRGPRRSCSACSRRSRSSRTRRSRRDQMALIREALLREFERNSQDNGYLLNQIARRYEDGDAANVAAVDNLPEQIAALTGDAIQQAAQTYLDTDELREGHARARGQSVSRSRHACFLHRQRHAPPGRRARGHASSLRAAERSGDRQPAVRLRPVAVRRLFGARRRQGSARHACCRQKRRRQAGHHARRAARAVGQPEGPLRRPRRRDAAPGAAGLDRRAGADVRVLPERHDDQGHRAARSASPPRRWSRSRRRS